MSKPVHHTLDIYGTELHLAFDRAGWAALRRTNPDMEPPSATGHVEDTRNRDTDQQHVWIYVDHRRLMGDVPDLVDCIAHEATHVAQAIHDRHAIETSNGTWEPFAYLVGWVTAWIWRNLPQETA